MIKYILLRICCSFMILYFNITTFQSCDVRSVKSAASKKMRPGRIFALGIQFSTNRSSARWGLSQIGLRKRWKIRQQLFTHRLSSRGGSHFVSLIIGRLHDLHSSSVVICITCYVFFLYKWIKHLACLWGVFWRVNLERLQLAIVCRRSLKLIGNQNGIQTWPT